jgi:hypothetical protein
MPEILAFEDAKTTMGCIESANLVSPGEEPPFVKKPIGRQVDFTMDV